MSNKISKLREERSKNDEKIARLQSRNGEIDKQITELENLEIIGIVRSFSMRPEELAALIQTLLRRRQVKRNKKRLISCLLALLLCLACFPSAYAMGDDPEPLPVPEQESEVQEQEQGTVIAQRVQYDETTNKQFISISDRAGNIFYLIIDYDAPVDVYHLLP